MVMAAWIWRNPRSQLLGRSIFSSRCAGASPVATSNAGGVDAEARLAVAAERLEVVVEVPGVVDVGRAEADVVRRAEARGAVDGEAAVARLVGGEALEEHDVVGDR
jgi:hypothetical protein